LALVVSANGHARARLAQGVQFVDEDDARRPALSLREQIAHPRRAYTDEHLDEVAATETEERHCRLTRHGASQQRLAGPRWANEQHALGNAPAQRLIFLRRLEEVHHLAQLGDRFFDAGYILKRDIKVFLRAHLGLAAPEAQR